MSVQIGSLMCGLAFVLALSSCTNSDDAVRYVCRAEDGRGNVYEGSDLEMLNAAEDAIQKCETAALTTSQFVQALQSGGIGQRR